MPDKQSDPKFPPVALTMGDPASISAEITALAWMSRDKHQISPFFVLSHSSLYDGLSVPTKIITAPEEAIECFSHAMPVLELPKRIAIEIGKPDPATAAMTIRSIAEAVKYVRTGQASSVVTNPINKHVLYEAGFKFPGHTEYLAELASDGGKVDIHPVMMLTCSRLRTVPLTIHIPIEDVPQYISSELISKTARIISDDLKKYFGMESPRISVAGLNPHAGESGAMGRAEIEIIEPAIDALQQEGMNISGPFPADTLFHEAARENYDIVLAMYHDQALIPVKTLGFDEGVNVTLGLPLVRTSPDHGTAYDIAGKGLANPQSLIEALKLAQKMSRQALVQSHND